MHNSTAYQREAAEISLWLEKGSYVGGESSSDGQHATVRLMPH